jgi:CubicO group peptidase (beta-lactamase class C family)
MAAMDDVALRAEFERRTAAHEFSGVALAWRDGGPIFSFRGGLAHRGHGVPIDERTRFAVASITKMVTAIAALRLVERGLLRLDQRLVDLLPTEQRPAALTPQHTLHHVLAQTSGFANYSDDDDPTWNSWLANWDRIPMYHIRRPADMLPLFADRPAVFAPGQRYQYSDTNFLLAGLVLEAVTGRPYPEVAVDEVLRPAGMKDSSFEALDSEPARLATGYMTSESPPETCRTNTYAVTVTPMPDGGMISTAEDLARLVDALLAGRLLSPPLVAAMTTPQAPPSDDLEQYGYGCLLWIRDGEVVILGHGGSDPGVSALVSHHPAAGTTIVATCNFDRGAWAATQLLETALGLPDPRI